MIKIDGKTIHIEGKGIDIFMELTFILHEIRSVLDDEAVEMAVSLSETKAIEKIFGEVFGRKGDGWENLIEALEELAEGEA